MSHPIINGLATYGVIRLYNKNHPILAFLVTLLFTIGPVGLLFWLVAGALLLKSIFIPLLWTLSVFLVIGVMEMVLKNLFLGILAGVIYFLITLVLMFGKF